MSNQQTSNTLSGSTIIAIIACFCIFVMSNCGHQYDDNDRQRDINDIIKMRAERENRSEQRKREENSIKLRVEAEKL